MLENKHHFCGLASTKDINAFHDEFRKLEVAQTEFLSKNSLFRSKEYKWPLDSLHNWSRIVEYPYVYTVISEIKKLYSQKLSILDFGCGVTFFPFEVSKIGATVIGVDIDPITQKDINKAKDVFGFSDNDLNCLINTASRLEITDQSQDVIYSISVLEHMENPAEIIKEFHRVLKQDGHLILTFDIDLRGDKQIQPQEYEELKVELNKYFYPSFENRIIHPASMLTTVNSTYPMKSTLFFRILNKIKNIFRFFSNQSPILYPPYFLGCELLTMKKR